IKELLSDCCMLEDHCRLHGPNSDLSLLSDIHSNGQIAHHRSDERPRPAFDIAHPARVAIVTNVFCSYLTAAASHAPRSRRSIPIKRGVHGRRPTEAFHKPLGPGVFAGVGPPRAEHAEAHCTPIAHDFDPTRATQGEA